MLQGGCRRHIVQRVADRVGDDLNAVAPAGRALRDPAVQSTEELLAAVMVMLPGIFPV